MEESRYQELYEDCSDEQLEYGLEQTFGIVTVGLHALLAQLSVYHDREGWKQDDPTSFVTWVATKLRVPREVAAEWVRISQALKTLPNIAQAFGKGQLPYEKVRELTKFATPDSDEVLAETGIECTAATLKAMARQRKPVTVEDSEEAQRRRALRFRWDYDHRMLRLSGRLPEEGGALLVQALERIMDTAGPNPETGQYDPYEWQAADAMVELARARIAADSDRDRADIVVHVDADILATGEGSGFIQHGPAIAVETIHRLACDGRMQLVVEKDGQPVKASAMTQTVPTWAKRFVRGRDGSCRWPECERIAILETHHKKLRCEGGGHEPSNLVTLCASHHRFVHEKGWRIEGDPSGPLKIIRPDGRVVNAGPPRLRRDVRDRLFGRRDPPVDSS